MQQWLLATMLTRWERVHGVAGVNVLAGAVYEGAFGAACCFVGSGDGGRYVYGWSFGMFRSIVSY